jgi:hypothetical protein
MPKISEGTYTHRFQGNALNKKGTVFYIAGQGMMDIESNGDAYRVVGRQESVGVPFQLPAGNVKPEDYVVNRQFEFTGEVNWNSDMGMWAATIDFVGIGEASGVALTGTYSLTATENPNNFWVMSTGSRITKGENLIPAEAVSGEVRLIRPKV